MKQLYIILYKYSKHRLFVIGVGVGVGGPEEGIEAVYRIRGGTGGPEEKEDKEVVEVEDQRRKRLREGIGLED
jgi:hypothetical protein